MKRFLVILGVLIVLGVIGIGIFLATFDVDRYRPQLISQLERAVGRPVTLKHISLGWRSGIAVELEGLAIYEDAQAKLEPLLQVESANALVHLLPLLRKEVHVSSITLQRPRIRIARDAQGHVNLIGLMAVASPAAGARPTEPASNSSVRVDVASLMIVDGSLHWSDALTTPPTELWVKRLEIHIKHIAPGRPMDVDVQAALAGTTPNVHLSGRLTLPSATSQGSAEQVTLAMEELPLEQLLPTAGPQEPQLRGRLTLRFLGGVTTLEPSQWLHALLGSGSLQLKDPVIANLNLLRAVFERFSMLPGLMQTLEERLPASYQQKLAAKDTAFSPINVSMEVEAGTLRFEPLALHTDTFGLSGAGSITLEDVGMNIHSVLQVEPGLSAAMIRSVAELQALTNGEGALEIPVTIQGQAPRVAVRPDMHYVASKIIATQATHLLDRALQRLNKGTTPPPADQSQQSQSTTPAQGSILDQFLQRALERNR